MTQSKTIQRCQFQFRSADGLHIACVRWDSRGPIRGIVQIAHGLGEHIGRYAALIEYLVQAGLVVYGNDHRGHGRTAPSPKHFGDFGVSQIDDVSDISFLLCLFEKCHEWERSEERNALIEHFFASMVRQFCNMVP